MGERMGHQLLGAKAPRRFFGDAHWAEPSDGMKTRESRDSGARLLCEYGRRFFERRADLKRRAAPTLGSNRPNA